MPGGAAGADAAAVGARSTDGPGCPDAAWDGACSQRLVVELDFTGVGRMLSGVWAEPLQLPSFEGVVPGPNLPSAKEPPDWDRSELPEGACVFRLRGTQLGCLSPDTVMRSGPCDTTELHPPVPTSYYEYSHCREGIAPGCPSDNPFVAGEVHAWYFRPSPDGEIDVVACAGLCKGLRAGKACLRGPFE